VYRKLQSLSSNGPEKCPPYNASTSPPGEVDANA
jgi:hypothetical protein